MRYLAYGVVLETQELLHELEPVDANPNAPVVQLVRELGPVPELPGAVALPHPDGEEPDWPSTTRGDSFYHLHFAGEADFWVARDGTAIKRFARSAPNETDRHLLLDHVLPRALCLLGRHPLHATAVAADHGVLAFLGKTGTGKSAMAAALGTLGCRLVCDDCLVLRATEQGVLAVPSYSGLRLLPDVLEVLYPTAMARPVAHYSTKLRVAEGMPLVERTLPLSGVYVLERRPEHEGNPLFERLGPADAIMALSSCAFRMDITQREPLTRQLRFFAEIVTQVPIHRCRLPSSLHGLQNTALAILENASAR